MRVESLTVMAEKTHGNVKRSYLYYLILLNNDSILNRKQRILPFKLNMSLAGENKSQMTCNFVVYMVFSETPVGQC